MSSSSVATPSVGDPARSWAPEAADRRRWWGLADVLAAGVAGGITYALVSRGAIMMDDVGHLRLVQEQGLSLDLVFTPVFDHFAPGHRLLTVLHAAVGPLQTDVMYGVMAACVALSVLVLLSIMRRLYGHRWWLSVAALLAFLNPFAIDVASWFASAYHQVPAMLLGLVALDTFLRYRASGRTWWVVASVGAVVLGLLFVSKVLLFVGAIVLLDALLLHERPLREVPRALAAEWPLWTAYAVPVLIYLAVAAQTIEERPVGELADVVGGARLIWLVRLVPTLFGLAVTSDAQGMLGGTDLGVALLGQVLLAALFGVSVARRRSSGRAFAVVGVLFVVNAVMTLTTRVSLFGPAVGLNLYRYWFEPFVLAVLLLPWGFARREPGQLPVRVAPAIAGVASLLLVASAVGNGVHAWRHHEQSQALQAGRWFDNAIASVAVAGAQVSVVDDRMPEPVAPYWLVHGQPVSDLGFLFPTLSFDGAPTGKVFAADGRLVDVRFTSWFRARGADLPSNTLMAVRGDHDVQGDALCFDGPLEVEVHLGQPTAPQYARVAVDRATEVAHRPLTPHPGALPGDRPVDVPGGGGAVLVPLSLVDSPGHVLTLQPHDGRACLESLAFGELDDTAGLGWASPE